MSKLQYILSYVKYLKISYRENRETVRYRVASVSRRDNLSLRRSLTKGFFERRELLSDARKKTLSGRHALERRRLLENPSMYPMSEGEYRTGLRTAAADRTSQIRSSLYGRRRETTAL